MLTSRITRATSLTRCAHAIEERECTFNSLLLAVRGASAGDRHNGRSRPSHPRKTRRLEKSSFHRIKESHREAMLGGGECRVQHTMLLRVRESGILMVYLSQVEDILQRRHHQSQPLANGEPLYINPQQQHFITRTSPPHTILANPAFRPQHPLSKYSAWRRVTTWSFPGCSRTRPSWAQARTRCVAARSVVARTPCHMSSVAHCEVQPPKEEKAFAKRGSILGSLTASISEALSSSSASQPAAAAPASPASDESIFSSLKRKGSAFSDAIFNPSDGGGQFHLKPCIHLQRLTSCAGRRPSTDAPLPPPRRMSDIMAGAAPRMDAGGNYVVVQAILDDMGSGLKASASTACGVVAHGICRTCCRGSKNTITATMLSVLARAGSVCPHPCDADACVLQLRCLRRTSKSCWIR